MKDFREIKTRECVCQETLWLAAVVGPPLKCKLRHRFRPLLLLSLPLSSPLPPPCPGVVGASRPPAIQHGVERDGALAGPPLGNSSDDALFTHNWNRSRR